MMQTCIDIFRHKYERNKQIITDNYIFAPGVYVMVDYLTKKEITTMIVAKNDKTQKDTYYYNLAFLDYNSRLITMNKSIDTTKTIHSNNYLSFFVKNEGKLTTEKIEKYYEILKTPETTKYRTKKEQRELYQQYLEKNPAPDQTLATTCQEWINANIFQLLEKYAETLKKNYLKIFFVNSKEIEATKKLYEIEGNRYVFPNIFNDAKYNQKIDGVIYGMPGANLGLNAKKPFLANKTKLNELPYFLSIDDALMQKKFFDYLETLCNAGKNIVYIDVEKKNIAGFSWLELPDAENFSGLFLSIKKGKEIEVHDIDVVPNISNKLKPSMEIVDQLQLELSKVETKTLKKFPLLSQMGKPITKKTELAGYIDQVFFNNAIKYNHLTSNEDLKFTKKGKQIFMTFRNAYNDWFYKDEKVRFIKLVDKLLLKQIMNTFEQAERPYFFEVQQMLILRENLLSYYLPKNQKGGETMENKRQKVADIREKVENIVLNGIGEIETDAEFYYAVGQLAAYLLSLSQAQYITLEPAVRIMNKKDVGAIRKEVAKLTNKYDHAIRAMQRPEGKKRQHQYSLRFSNLHTACTDYKELKEKFDENNYQVINGFTSSILIYEKEDKKEGEE